jgi:hypothetical protein
MQIAKFHLYHGYGSLFVHAQNEMHAALIVWYNWGMEVYSGSDTSACNNLGGFVQCILEGIYLTRWNCSRFHIRFPQQLFIKLLRCYEGEGAACCKCLSPWSLVSFLGSWGRRYWQKCLPLELVMDCLCWTSFPLSFLLFKFQTLTKSCPWNLQEKSTSILQVGWWLINWLHAQLELQRNIFMFWLRWDSRV